MSGLNTIESTQAKQKEQLEQVLRMQMMRKMLKEALGDGMEFELVYQAMLDSVTNTKNNSSQDALKAMITGSNTNTSNINLSDIKSLLNNGANYNSMINRVSTATYNGNDSEKSRIYSAVNEASKKYGIDSNLILSVIEAESNFDVNAVSSVGAQGLMQVMPSNLKAMGVVNGYDIYENINAGTSLLKQYLDMYNGNMEMGLMAYNAGPGTIKNRGVSSPSELYKMPSETRNYVTKVMNSYRSKL